MQAAERQLLKEQLIASEARLLALVESLQPGQWRFCEAPGRWSIAEIVEHLAVFEEFIRGAVQKSLEVAPARQEKSTADEKESLVMGLPTSRNVRFQAREATQPNGRWTETKELIAEFRRARARTIAFVAETQNDLRAHFFQHIAFGNLDGYQWLLLIGQHTLRHCAQVEEVQAAALFPSA